MAPGDTMKSCCYNSDELAYLHDLLETLICEAKEMSLELSTAPPQAGKSRHVRALRDLQPSERGFTCLSACSFKSVLGLTFRAEDGL